MGGMIEPVFVEGGTFQMGSNSGDPDEKPVHTIISRLEKTLRVLCHRT